MSCSFSFASGCSRLGSLSSTLAVLWTQQRCCRGLGYTCLKGFPKAQGSVADRQLRIDHQPPGLHVQEQPFPRLLALAIPSTTAINSFFPSAVAPISTRMHCRSSSRRMLKCTPSAHTYTYCLPSKDRFVPLLEFFFPNGLQPGDGRGRQARTVRPHQGFQGLAEVARADALQVQPGDQLLDALGLSQVRRQNLRGERLGFGPLAVDPALSAAAPRPARLRS